MDVCRRSGPAEMRWCELNLEGDDDPRTTVRRRTRPCPATCRARQPRRYTMDRLWASRAYLGVGPGLTCAHLGRACRCSPSATRTGWCFYSNGLGWLSATARPNKHAYSMVPAGPQQRPEGGNMSGGDTIFIISVSKKKKSLFEHQMQ